MLESNNELKAYIVTFENDQGVLYSQTVLATNKRHAILSGINNNNKDNIAVEEFTPIDARLLTDFNQFVVNTSELKVENGI